MPTPPISFRLLPALAAVTLLAAGCARQNFFQPDARPNAATPLPAAADSVRGATAGRQYADHGGLFQLFFGKHHRQVWATPVSLPVLDLATAAPGGLRTTKLGGGFNSTSLSAVAAGGQPFVIRTVDKDPGRAMPPFLRRTFLANYLRDNVSATHPYAALTVPPLARAVGVATTTPRLYYTRPDAPGLAGDSLSKLRGQLVMVEEKFNGAAAVGLPGVTDIVDSEAMFAKVYADPRYRFDAPALLRARLLDAWLGDWDRHVGQWTWADVPDRNNMSHRYLPVPKDRDMVFYKADDGIIPWLLTRPFTIRHWTTFKPHYTDEVGLMENGHPIDERGLASLSRRQFQAVAQAMRQQLTDSLIIAALRRMPAAVYARDGVALATALRARREALPAFADKFYRHLARHVMVGGTESAERFAVTRYADSTVVTVSSTAAGLLFQRTFLPAETRTITLEGLGGDDTFTVSGYSANQPRLHIYGGPGTNTLDGNATARGVRFSQKSRNPKRAYNLIPQE